MLEITLEQAQLAADAGLALLVLILHFKVSKLEKLPSNRDFLKKKKK